MKKAAFLGLFLLLPLPLGAVETVKSPVVEEGAAEIEHKGRYQHDANPAKDNEKELEFAFGYGVTDKWKTKLEAAFEQKRNSDIYYKAFKWENIYNLNGKDVQNEVVFGLYQDIGIADRSDSTHALTLGFLARRDFGKWAHTGNLLFKRDFGDTAKTGISFIYRWQTKYALDAAFQPGFEIMGDTQTNDQFRDNNLMIGPVIFGNFDLLGVSGFGYEVGYLFGATPAARDGTVKWKIKYGFTF